MVQAVLEIGRDQTDGKGDLVHKVSNRSPLLFPKIVTQAGGTASKDMFNFSDGDKVFGAKLITGELLVESDPTSNSIEGAHDNGFGNLSLSFIHTM